MKSLVENPYIISVPGVKRTFDRRLILLINMVPLALALIQISSVNVALPSIEFALSAHSSDIQWVLSGYSLAFGMSLVPSGRIGDAIGRSSMFVIGLGLFGVASLVCGLATDPMVLNIARVFQGLGAGIQGPQTTGMIQQYFRGQGRAQAYSLQGMVVAVSVAIGPVITGVLITTVGDLGWRLPFLINFPLGLLGCLLALRWLPFESERARASSEKKGPKTKLDLDPFGATLLTLAVVCVMLPFMLTDEGMWRFSLLAVAVVLSVLWLIWERQYKRRNKQPMVDLSLFRVGSFSRQTLVSTLDFLGITSLFVVLAMYLQNGLGWDAMQSGFIVLGDAALSCVGAMWVGKHVLAKKNKLIVLSLAVILAGTLGSLLVFWLVMAYSVSPWWLLLTLGIYGFGQGAFGASNQTLSMMDVPLNMSGTAGGVKSMSERVATAIGNTMMTGVFFAVLPVFGWHGATMVVYAAIALVIVIAVGFGLVYLTRELRRAQNAS